MRDFPAYKQTAIRYWERRRIIYNLALVPPSLFGYLLCAGLAYVDDPPPMLYGLLLFWFAMSAFGANICYSFAYALEFFFGSDDPTSWWLQSGRTTVFIGGVLFAMFLALIGGRNIARIEYYENVKHARNQSLQRLS
jgi:hypothetical protein